MSASIDKDPTAEGEDARDVLASWLDDFSAGRCEREDMQASFLSICRSSPDAPWDALALLDQYQRRGKIDAELARSQALISEAHDTLLDPLRRRAYDLSTFPDAANEPKQRDTRREAALEAERALLREELAAELTAQTNFTGPLLRKVRESMGVELAEISARTKISVGYLSAIEDERFAELPAFVYLRGFVTEFAKFLKLDVTQVSRTYLRRYRAWKSNDLTVER